MGVIVNVGVDESVIEGVGPRAAVETSVSEGVKRAVAEIVGEASCAVIIGVEEGTKGGVGEWMAGNGEGVVTGVETAKEMPFMPQPDSKQASPNEARNLDNF